MVELVRFVDRSMRWEDEVSFKAVELSVSRVRVFDVCGSICGK